MKAILRRGPGKAALISRDMPVPGPKDVVIKVKFSGICGSDIHRFTEDNPRWDQIVLGHEFSGIIHQTGNGVSDLLPGDAVTAAPLLPCHKCAACQKGDFSLCGHYSFSGSRVDGCFAEYVKIPAANVIKFEDGFPLEKGAFMEPVTVCLHPILRLGNLLGKTVVVTGLGAIGLLAVQIFKAMGARHIVASDIVPEKLALAKQLGASQTVNAADLETALNGQGGADVVFESSGANPAKQTAIRITKGRGQILLVGTSPGDIQFDAALFEQITRKEISLTGSWMNYSAPWPGPEWDTAYWMLKKGLIDTDALTTQRFALDDFQKALDVITKKEELFIKILIKGEAS